MTNNKNPKQFSNKELQRMQNEMTPGHPDFQYAGLESMIDDENVVSLQSAWNGKAESLTLNHLQNFAKFLNDFDEVATNALKDWIEATEQVLPHKNFLQECSIDYQSFADDPEEVTFTWDNYHYYNETEYFSFPTKFIFEPERAVEEFFEKKKREEKAKEKANAKAKKEYEQNQYQKFLKLKAKYEGENNDY